MKSYLITIYDPQTHRTTTLADMPERRTDPNRPKGKATILKWIKAIYGQEWTTRNKHLIGIIEHNGRKAE